MITVDWLPDVGTVVDLNGEMKGHAIPDPDLYRAFLKVWLGERPTNPGLKRALLGQTHQGARRRRCLTREPDLSRAASDGRREHRFYPIDRE